MIPTHIKIGNIEYTIEKVDHPLAVDHAEVGGLIEFRTGTIMIREDGFSEDAQEETFWHEVMHAITRNKDIAFDDEEMVCRRFARGMHALMKDNAFEMPGQPSSPERKAMMRLTGSGDTAAEVITSS